MSIIIRYRETIENLNEVEASWVAATLKALKTSKDDPDSFFNVWPEFRSWPDGGLNRFATPELQNGTLLFDHSGPGYLDNLGFFVSEFLRRFRREQEFKLTWLEYEETPPPFGYGGGVLSVNARTWYTLETYNLRSLTTSQIGDLAAEMRRMEQRNNARAMSSWIDVAVRKEREDACKP